MPASDYAPLSEALDEARELDAIRKDCVERLSALRVLCFTFLNARKGSEAQAKATAKQFPPRGRGASKK